MCRNRQRQSVEGDGNRKLRLLLLVGGATGRRVFPNTSEMLEDEPDSRARYSEYTVEETKEEKGRDLRISR